MREPRGRERAPTQPATQLRPPSTPPRARSAAGTWAAPQKRAWVARELGAHVPVITCPAKEKGDHCSPAGSVLVDDMEKNREPWVAGRARGTFVLHTSAARSIEELKRLGFV